MLKNIILLIALIAVHSNVNASVLQSSLCNSVLQKNAPVVLDLLPLDDDQLKSAILKLIQENMKIEGIKNAINTNEEWQWLFEIIRDQKERFVRFNDYDEYLNATRSDDFEYFQIARIPYQRGQNVFERIIFDHENVIFGHHRSRFSFTRYQNKIFFSTEFYYPTARQLETPIMELKPDGSFSRFIKKTDFLLDSYPNDQILLTRTMSEQEFRMWNDPNQDPTQIGSENMKKVVGESEAKNISFASDGYLNDKMNAWWERQIEILVPKATLQKWVQSKAVYMTSLGYYFDEPSEAESHHQILLRHDRRIPFEFASLSKDVHRELFEIYHHSLKNPDPELVYYRQEAKQIQAANEAIRNISSLLKRGIRVADIPPEVRQVKALEKILETLIQTPEGELKVKQLRSLLKRTEKAVKSFKLWQVKAT